MKIIRTLLALALALLAPVLHAADFTGGAITINDNANASPYPSTVTVSGITGPVAAVQVRITGFTHSYPKDVDVFLVAPSGAVAAVFSDAGVNANGFGVTNLNLLFDDTAATLIPDGAQITSGTYRPANHEPVEALPPGATGTIGTNLTALAAGGANGQWKLFARDDSPSDSGSIASWTLSITPAFLVTNTNDSGPGSLRWALDNAAANPGPDTITFDPSLNGLSIALLNGAPDSGSGASAIYITSTDAVTIDATALPAGLTLTRPSGAGGNGYRCLRVGAASTVTLRGVKISGFSGQATQSGGAVLNEHTLAMESCTVSGNTADGAAGAIRNAGTLTLTQCTLSGNTANGISGGGTIYHTGNAATLTQCTLSGNAAPNGNGGGIVNTPASAATCALTHCTVAGNSAGLNGGGIYNTGFTTTLSLTGTIVALNTAGGFPKDIRNINGIVTSGGRNFIGNNSTTTAVFPAGAPNGNGDIVGTDAAPLDPLLAPLGSYGGPTQTMPPLAGSPAVNAAVGSTITSDQRGFPISGVPDIGAAEQRLAVVTSNGNSGPGTLRQAIADAATSQNNSITFAPGLSGGTITLGSEIIIPSPVLVDASGLASGVTLSGGNTNRIFYVNSGQTVF